MKTGQLMLYVAIPCCDELTSRPSRFSHMATPHDPTRPQKIEADTLETKVPRPNIAETRPTYIGTKYPAALPEDRF
jgi:hypothetical protein